MVLPLRPSLMLCHLLQYDCNHLNCNSHINILILDSVRHQEVRERSILLKSFLLRLAFGCSQHHLRKASFTFHVPGSIFRLHFHLYSDHKQLEIRFGKFCDSFRRILFIEPLSVLKYESREVLRRHKWGLDVDQCPCLHLPSTNLFCSHFR